MGRKLKIQLTILAVTFVVSAILLVNLDRLSYQSVVRVNTTANTVDGDERTTEEYLRQLEKDVSELSPEERDKIDQVPSDQQEELKELVVQSEKIRALESELEQELESIRLEEERVLELDRKAEEFLNKQ